MSRKIRYTLIMLMAMLWGGGVCAQEQGFPLTTIDWTTFHLDSIMPEYDEVIPLESDHNACDYTVELLFPTFKPFTYHELSLLRKKGKDGEPSVEEQLLSVVGEDIVTSQEILDMRGKGFMGLSFVPVVRRNGKLFKLLSAEIVITPIAKARSLSSAKAMTVDERYTRQSVLSSGNWRRISITTDGMYRLTSSFLSSLGFTDISCVHLYGYGGHEQPTAWNPETDFDDLEEVPLYTAPDGSLLFWGNGLLTWKGAKRVFNAYANKACYFLTQGDKRDNIETVESYTGTTRNNISTRLCHALYEVDSYAWHEGGRNLQDASIFEGSTSKTYSLTLPDGASNEVMSLVYAHAGSEKTQLGIGINNTSSFATPSISTADANSVYREYPMSATNVSSLKVSSTWTVKLTTPSTGYGSLDYIAMSATAPITLQNGFVQFGGGYYGMNGTSVAPYYGATTFSSISGASDLVVMRVGKRGDPACLMATENSDGQYSFSVEDGSRDFIAFSPSYSFPIPADDGAVANQNIHSIDSVDMVIVVPTSGTIAAQAERLAQAHVKYDNMRVAIVPANKIYNEFSSGTPDATAYRRFFKMIYDRGVSASYPLRNVLLFGDCAWDNRMLSKAWKSKSPDDYLLCFESENSYSKLSGYLLEDYFALMGDKEGSSLVTESPDLGVGRIPAVTVAQAKAAVDKTIEYMDLSNAGNWKNLIAFLGDDGDDNEHMIYANAVADTLIKYHPEHDYKKIYWDNYQRYSTSAGIRYPDVTAAVNQLIADGVGIVNYTGHGGPTQLSHEFSILSTDFQSWKYSELPLWYTAACETAPFDASSNDNLGEDAITCEGGGALAFVGTGRTVTSGSNHILNEYFMQSLFASTWGRPNTLGEALCVAKTKAYSTGVNKANYAILGDPALFFCHFPYRVVLDSINGVVVSDTTLTIEANSRCRISGHVETEDGDIASNYTGICQGKFYDSEETLKTRGNTSSAMPYVDRPNLITEFVDSIVDGRWTHSFIIPRDINNDYGDGRFVFYAISEDSLEASGYSEDTPVGGYSHELDEYTTGPSAFVYLNRPEFKDGETVNATPLFVADLESETAISVSSRGVGHNMELCIDSIPSLTYDLTDYYISSLGDDAHGTVMYTIPELSDGAHRLYFRAWDKLNNSTLKTLSFVVDSSMDPSPLSVTTSNGICDGNTNLIVSYNLPGTECHFVVEVFSVNGQRQWYYETDTSSSTGYVTIPWGSRNNSGGHLAGGVYVCRVTARTKTSDTVEAKEKIIIGNNN